MTKQQQATALHKDYSVAAARNIDISNENNGKSTIIATSHHHRNHAMSCELYIYSPKATEISFNHLRSLMAAWDWDIRALKQFDTVIESDHLTECDLIIGWDRTCRYVVEFAYLFTPGRQVDFRAIDENKELLLGGCEFSVDVPTSLRELQGDSYDEWWEGIEDEINPEIQAHLQETRSRRFLRASMRMQGFPHNVFAWFLDQSDRIFRRD